ncbi:MULTISPECIES: potassium channel family protein [Trueperella]|uniref:TrkA family potassium uptake protein n=2 Tax=Trueperella bernardiae TaxID=59561 RepID=A0AAW6ZN68_9ACTO|nr:MULTISPECIES: TrkA family potassium uptake protein [Trueperella]MCM3906525.1 TrkA family potassium uptake protein [Trueperella bernardiae]MDK8602602.1 TrkA family potassium uptake protein [Trueperella bernardiae]MDV6239005.1 TrkA family potassium uptake protein [Trueperella bernardiae]WIM08699.1 TrkA family potassium uptake protein [Trueperella bernardiae]
MHFVIMGCGRVGASLAVNIADRGHSVAIIDQNSHAFQRLPDSFQGQQVTGVGFDRDALRQAGIEEAAGFAAVSSGDNSNIIAARVVRETFGVDNVVARIYDSSRAGVYNKLGIDVVAPVSWTADQVMRNLIPLGPYVEHIDSATGTALFFVDLDPSWYGRTVADIEAETGARLAYITRNLQLVMPTASTVIQDGDELRFVAALADAQAIQRVTNHPAKVR